MTEEHWAKVVGLEERYEVSDAGRVRSVGFMCMRVGVDAEGRRLITPRPVKDGYLTVRIGPRGKLKARYIHHLVCEAFIGPRLPGMQTNHKNGDVTDNSVGNLEWVTAKENDWHKTWVLGYANGVMPNHWLALLNEEKANDIRVRRAAGEQLKSIAKSHGVAINTVWKVVVGETWRHNAGEHW